MKIMGSFRSNRSEVAVRPGEMLAKRLKHFHENYLGNSVIMLEK